MTEQTAPSVGGDQIEFPGCIQFEQRLPTGASPQGNGPRRDVFTGRSPSRPSGDSTEFAASARLIAAADDAKRRIERDLHDGLQQRLVSLGLRARLAEASVARDQQELKCELALIAEGLLEALETLREISRGIHPAILSERGLGPAVETLARRSLVPVKLHSSVEGRLPGRVEVGAYYIICEALANAAKHAKATAVDISVEQRGYVLDLSVRDDGIGGADGSGLGLTGLADRVNALAGTMQLVSPRAHGTLLRVRLPIRPGQLDCGVVEEEHYELESANGRGANPGTGGGDPHCLPADERYAPKSLARQR
jgi:signal transduction histidine kinase